MSICIILQWERRKLEVIGWSELHEGCHKLEGTNDPTELVSVVRKIGELIDMRHSIDPIGLVPMGSPSKGSLPT
ncbi:MAG: hypothetical protein CMO80_11165 [Verrucomicrobiales bacterium]|nr:hypothetical protein [Verrucomicrobiales bacterium]